MALYNAFDKGQHLAELAMPYDDGQGTVMTPSERRSAVIANLFGTDPLAFTKDTTFSGTNGVTTNKLLTSTNVGTATNVTVEEHGDGVDHVTKVTLSGFVVGTGGDSASLALGAKFYTWPTGKTIEVVSATWAGGLTYDADVTTDTPELGIGTVAATGAAATLTTGTWENIMDGGATMGPTTGGDAVAIAPDVAGTVFYKKSLSTVSPIIKPSGGQARDVFLNVADGWANVTTAGNVTADGVIILKWRVID